MEKLRPKDRKEPDEASVIKHLQDRVLEYLKDNGNHLNTYFLPENWNTPAN